MKYSLNDKISIISIHAPYAGCDIISSIINKAKSISIHAPYAGCDVFLLRANSQ